MLRYYTKPAVPLVPAGVCTYTLPKTSRKQHLRQLTWSCVSRGTGIVGFGMGSCLPGGCCSTLSPAVATACSCPSCARLALLALVFARLAPLALVPAGLIPLALDLAESSSTRSRSCLPYPQALCLASLTRWLLFLLA